MNKEEYNLQKEKIIQTFGQPNEDTFNPNESRIKLGKLKAEYLVSCRNQQKKDAKKAGQKQETELQDLPEVKAYVKENEKKASILIGNLEINDNDLLPFNQLERDVIRIKFDNWNLTHKQIANKCSDLSRTVTRQQVTATLDSPAFKILQQRYFDKLLPLEVNLALLAAVRQGDTKIVTRLAEQYNIMKPEKMEIDLNKPIEDAEALKMLRELGDKLIDDKK